MRPGNFLNSPKRSFVAPSLPVADGKPMSLSGSSGSCAATNGCVASPCSNSDATSTRPEKTGWRLAVASLFFQWAARHGTRVFEGSRGHVRRKAGQLQPCGASRLLGRCRSETFRKSASIPLAVLTPAQRHDLKGKNFGRYVWVGVTRYRGIANCMLQLLLGQGRCGGASCRRRGMRSSD